MTEYKLVVVGGESRERIELSSVGLRSGFHFFIIFHLD